MVRVAYRVPAGTRTPRRHPPTHNEPGTWIAFSSPTCLPARAAILPGGRSPAPVQAQSRPAGGVQSAVVIEISAEGGGHPVEVGTRSRVPAVLPVLPLRETVPLPDTLTPLAIGQERSIELVNDVLAGDRLLVMVASRNPELEAPGPAELHDVGVVGAVARMLKVPDGTLRILVQGAQRVKLTGWVRETPYLV